MNTIKLNTIGEGPVKVPASGGEGGGEGQQLDIAYFDTTSITSWPDHAYPLYGVSFIVKERNGDGALYYITPYSAWADRLPSAVGIILNQPTTIDDNGTIVTQREALSEFYPWILELPRLTEEEFYSVPTGDSTLTVVRCTGEEIPISYNIGMTWGEWANSPLNNTKIVVDYDLLCIYGYSFEQLVNADHTGDYPHYKDDCIKTSDIISADINYTTYDYS